MTIGLFNRFDFNRDEPEGGSAGSTEVDLLLYKMLGGLTIQKSMNDEHWRLSATIDGYQSLAKNLKFTKYSATDHLGTSRMLFSGILPIFRPEIGMAEDRTSVEGYDYGWYLSHQPVPPEYTHITASVNPATVITALLGGDNWATETGIEPYRIDTVTEYGVTLNSKTWDFEKTTSKTTVIKRLASWCRYIPLVQWNPTTGSPRFYWVSEANIDTRLDLPVGVTLDIATDHKYVDGKITYDVKGDARYNKVIVYGRSSTGQSLKAELQSVDVTNGAIPIVFPESSGAFSTQAQLNTRAAELYSYKASLIKVYTVTLINRMDLVPLQKVRFTGWTGVDEDWCRITSVKRMIDGPLKRVQIEFMSDALFFSIQQMYRESNPDEISQIESVFDAKAFDIPGNKFRTVTAKDAATKTATIQLDDGTAATANYS